MKVHVVAASWDSDQVLARFARALLRNESWTVGDRHDPQADVNLFEPYLLFERSCMTKTAAWFTHKEESGISKTRTWDEVANHVDLRLVTAGVYLSDLEAHGVTVKVPPALDRDFFTLAGRPPTSPRVHGGGAGPRPRSGAAQKRIGLVGTLYASGRKGEELAKAVAGYGKQNHIEVIATERDMGSHRSWPCETRELHWQDMPAFYQSLSVYVCTSLVEGVPMPPLEALACGIPIVIPRNVGMLDDLPTLRGIHRYERGDANDLLRALDAALEGCPDCEALRSATEPFTEETWRLAVKAALDTYLPIPTLALPPPPPVSALAPILIIAPEEKNSLYEHSGVYVVAYKDQARKCAGRCIKSVHAVMPGLPVALVGEEPLGVEDIFIQQPLVDLGARSQKTRLADLAPADWQYIIYLDADTEVIEPLDPLLRILHGGWDMFICTGPAEYILAGKMRRPDNIEELKETFQVMQGDQYLQYNGGVFGFQRNPQAVEFMRSWHREWDRWGKRDQAALDRVIYSAPIKIWTLGPTWNRSVRYPWDGPVCVKHYQTEARSWHGIQHERTAAAETATKGIMA